ncbi:hypothetical protein DESAMIL20_87 [Desulfurella amilsii]|uniref:Type 4 fimbrial biogenesis protein PilX N-terminal domain-containing protein n=1 Tax=Desulfurella amilsii TaxID=1562698 RepID=A0A1X4XZK3_9BACT|nr:hypothetical protein [Desulfurella amilsii]OSS42979.1 hypothetical protein DESAMIL20_87 [Desulfurella amilsii]
MKKSSEEGIALIVAILLSFMTLALIGALLWLVVESTKMSSMHKQYSSAHDAAIGGAEVIMDALYWGQNPNLPAGTYSINDQSCFRIKRENPTQYWGSCLNSSPDITINFGKINSSSDYYNVGITITSTTIAPACAASSTPAAYTYAVSVDATDPTKLDKAGIDFVYYVGK